jgi:phage I-like protein
VSRLLSERVELSAQDSLVVSGAEVPKELRIFAFGETKTTKGPFVLDKTAADDVMTAFKDSGRDLLPFDAGHGHLSGAGSHPGAHKALGWFRPEIRDDGLWAADIQWTKKTEAALSEREFRYFSPAVNFDPKSRRIKSLINVALTNHPATIGQKPMVLSDDKTEDENTMNPLLAKLGATDEDAALSAVVSLQSEVATLSSENLDLKTQVATLTAQSVKDKRDAKLAALTAEGKLAPAMLPFAETLSLEQLDQFAATLSVARPVPVEQPATSTATLSDLDKKVCKQLGISEEDYLAARKGA